MNERMTKLDVGMECHRQSKEGRGKSNEKRQKEKEGGIEAEARGQYTEYRQRASQAEVEAADWG